MGALDRSPGCRGGTGDRAVFTLAGPGLATFEFGSLTALHAGLDRVYKLPDAPLARFRAQTARLSQSTEAERLVVQRIGQVIFRAALMDY